MQNNALWDCTTSKIQAHWTNVAVCNMKDSNWLWFRKVLFYAWSTLECSPSYRQSFLKMWELVSLVHSTLDIMKRILQYWLQLHETTGIFIVSLRIAYWKSIDRAPVSYLGRKWSWYCTFVPFRGELFLWYMTFGLIMNFAGVKQMEKERKNKEVVIGW